ncbi:MAG: hypothetical protein WA717_02155 [Methyloceanibacter sp.]
MSFDSDSGLQWWLNSAGVEFSKKETRTCTYRASISPRLIRPAEMKGAMRKVSEYEAHAAECRRLADQMSNPEHKTKLIQMAETWEMLAIARVKQLSRKKSKGDA